MSDFIVQESRAETDGGRHSHAAGSTHRITAPGLFEALVAFATERSARLVGAPHSSTDRRLFAVIDDGHDFYRVTVFRA